MKSLTQRLTEVFSITLLLIACVVSAEQLTVKVQANAPACGGLTCWDVSDCGPCFCNRPSSTCYSWDLDQQ